MTKSGYRRSAGRGALAFTLAALVLAAAPLGAQEGRPRPPLLRASGSQAWGIASEVASSGVSTASIRVEVPVSRSLSPWVSWSEYQLSLACIPENPTCPADGHTWLVGVMLDASGPRRSIARPFLGMGIGQWRNDEKHGTAHSGVFGLALELIPVLAPRLEVRIEKYPPFGEHIILGVGAQLTIPRPHLGRSTPPEG